MLKTDFFQRALPWTELILDNRDIANDLNTNISSRLSIVFLFILISSIVISRVHPPYILLTGAGLVGLLFCNFDVYLFLENKKDAGSLYKRFPGTGYIILFVAWDSLQDIADIYLFS